MTNKQKTIAWITADYFIDVDFSLVPYLKEHSQYNIEWYVIKHQNNKIELPSNLDATIYTITHRGKDIRIIPEYHNILKKILKNKPSFIYSDYLGMPFYYPILFYMNKNIPVIHAAHNVIPYKGWSNKRLMTWYVNYIFKKNQYFQIFSKHLLNYFNKNFPGKKVLECTMTLKSYGNTITNNYNIDSQKINLLFFGNVRENKRLDLLINALTELPDNIQEKLHLTIAGKCDNTEKYLALIGTNKNITTFFKRIDDNDIPELFSKHQYLMLPYEDIAQSGPHMIAYYYNLPVIASDIKGFSERIEDTVNGFLFTVNDKESLKKVLTKVSNQNEKEYMRIKNNLAQYTHDNYSLEVISQKYINFFNSIKSC